MNYYVGWNSIDVRVIWTKPARWDLSAIEIIVGSRGSYHRNGNESERRCQFAKLPHNDAPLTFLGLSGARVTYWSLSGGLHFEFDWVQETLRTSMANLTYRSFFYIGKPTISVSSYESREERAHLARSQHTLQRNTHRNNAQYRRPIGSKDGGAYLYYPWNEGLA
jgi:hypothetical protein